MSSWPKPEPSSVETALRISGITALGNHAEELRRVATQTALVRLNFKGGWKLDRLREINAVVIIETVPHASVTEKVSLELALPPQTA